MLIFEYYGRPLTHIKLVPGNTITSLSSYPELYRYTERTLAYTSGGTTEIVAGDWIIGKTGSAVAEVVSLTLASGTWAGGDAAGILRLRSQKGTFQSEKIAVVAGTDEATITANSKVAQDEYLYKGLDAKAALVVVYANTALVGLNGGKPDQTQLIGVPMVANSSLLLRNIDEIKNFKCVDYTASSASILQMTFFF